MSAIYFIWVVARKAGHLDVHLGIVIHAQAFPIDAFLHRKFLGFLAMYSENVKERLTSPFVHSSRCLVAFVVKNAIYQPVCPRHRAWWVVATHDAIKTAALFGRHFRQAIGC